MRDEHVNRVYRSRAHPDAGRVVLEYGLRGENLESAMSENFTEKLQLEELR